MEFICLCLKDKVSWGCFVFFERVVLNFINISFFKCWRRFFGFNICFVDCIKSNKALSVNVYLQTFQFD